jgi:hypothetical protein
VSDRPDAAELVERDVASCELVVAVEVRLDFADAAEPARVGAKTPGADERPRNVLDRVADVCELPVENGDEVIGDGEVAEPEVAVHERLLPRRPFRTCPRDSPSALSVAAPSQGLSLGRVRRVRGWYEEALAHPGESVLDRRMRLADGDQLVVEARDRIASREELERLDRVDLRQLVRHLQRQSLRRVAHESAPDRLAFDAHHRDCLPPVDIAQVRDRTRRADARCDGGFEHLELLLERQGVAMDHPHAGAAHEQFAPVGEIDGPRLLRCAAGDLAQLDDVRAEALRQLISHADWPPSTTSVWPVT